MNKSQYEEFKRLSKEYIIEEGKLLPSPFGGYILGVYGEPGFCSSQEQFSKVNEIRGRLIEAFKLLEPSDGESRKLKQLLERDKDIIETGKRVKKYIMRGYKTLPKVMKTCNEVINGSFSDEQIQRAEEVKKGVEKIEKQT